MKPTILAAALAALAVAVGAPGAPGVADAAAQTPAAERSVTVESFDGAELTGGVVTNDGLSALLVEVLLEGGTFAVLEKGVAGAKPRFLIKGSIVRFDATAGSSGVQLGGIPGAGRALGGKAQRRTSRVSVSLRLIDAGSGRILALARADGEAAAQEADASLTGTAMGASSLRATSVGKALEDAMGKAARDLARRV